MSTDNLNEREFELINIVGAELAANQRDLSRHMDLSLGSINMLLRRLVKKGYIRIHQLNKRKVQYILTPKGLSEKMRKSVKYTLKTIHSITLLKNKIKEVVLPLYEKGERNFYILGHSDLALLIEVVFKELALEGFLVHYIEEVPHEKVNGTILICREEVYPALNGNVYVDFIHEFASDHTLITQNVN